MAQTIIAKPQAFTPAYNPIKYIIDSTNKNKTGFRYIFQVYNGATLKGTFKVVPTFSTGYGEIDLSKFLSSYVSWDFDPTITQDLDAVNSFYNYDLNVGEEYLYELDYTSSLTASGTNTRINVTNIFQVGDQINITQDDLGVANPLLEGLHTVIAVSGSWIDVNVPFSSITNATINGTINYADNRKVVTYDITEIVSKKVFNGAISWIDFVVYNEQDYNLNGVTKQWLTNQPTTEFQCTLGQDLWLNARARVGKKIYFQNSEGDIYSKDIVNNDSIVQIAVGCNNYGVVTPIVGVLPMIKPDTEYYDFWYYDGAQFSQKLNTFQGQIEAQVALDQRGAHESTRSRSRQSYQCPWRKKRINRFGFAGGRFSYSF
jgi:hypothetical protein